MRDVQYDPNILQKVANKLYERASVIVAQLMFLCMILCGVAAFAGATTLHEEAGGWVLGASIFGLVLGYAIAQPRVLALRAEAQQLLVMREIARNTRMAAAGTGRAATPIAAAPAGGE